ncbi:UBX domain-containing protein 1-like isoform X2 [Homarus americanus]|uniref:UBX domain-containing protein 1-like isoform X2 n=1 Tax=Homarus americanus TaxID=6706 RepID=UPI001C43A1E6|nr:UBX domain-containing protein 1-like isoform X2 [Homarus americanus]
MSALQTLIEMGFSENSVKKALSATGGGGIEQAMEWLLAHADDPGINDPPAEEAPAPTTKTEEEKMDTTTTEGKEAGAGEEGTAEEEGAKSIKCDDCGKLFQTSEEVEFHAVKSGHSNFSESTEEKKPLTEEEKLLKKRTLEDKIRQRRREREMEEEKEARDRERKRIQMGQEIAERKRNMQDQELKRIAEERKKEKMEDKIARQKVKEEIERDRQARKEMFGNKGEEKSQAASVAPKPQPAPAAQTAPKKEYTTARLQIRLPSGTPLVQEFKAKESLSAVRLWISLNRQDGLPADAPFNLSMSFPRKVFSEEDMDKPLDILGLVPSAVLMVTK